MKKKVKKLWWDGDDLHIVTEDNLHSILVKANVVDHNCEIMDKEGLIISESNNGKV